MPIIISKQIKLLILFSLVFALTDFFIFSSNVSAQTKTIKDKNDDFKKTIVLAAKGCLK